MKLLVDENMEAPSVEWLRLQGHDLVLAAREFVSSLDTFLLEESVRSGRVIITRDKDFGELVFRDGLEAFGVILLRFGGSSSRQRVLLLEKWWPEIEMLAVGNLVVVSDEVVRSRKLPRID